MFSLICAWINRWVNIPEAGDSGCYHAHMMSLKCSMHQSTRISLDPVISPSLVLNDKYYYRNDEFNQIKTIKEWLYHELRYMVLNDKYYYRNDEFDQIKTIKEWLYHELRNRAYNQLSWNRSNGITLVTIRIVYSIHIIHLCQIFIENKHTWTISLPTLNSSSVSFIYVWHPKLASTAPADGLAPKGARPSAGTVLTKFSTCFL